MQLFEQDVKVDLRTLIDSRMLLCANSGGGKSWAVRKLLEEAGDEVMSIVLDVEGEFKTLREKCDFLLVGQGGDLPVNMKAVPLLPRKLLELSLSTIIDISDLKMHDRIQYVKKFLEALMELPRELWKSCLVIVDEAHLFAGQQEKQESCHAVIDLMTRGRKRGFCGVLCTQRIAKLHKDAVAESNNYMVGRTGLDLDMRRAAEILGLATKQDMLALRDLDPGEFYVFGPAISRHVQKVKVGRVKTTHPKSGMGLSTRVIPPRDKVKAVLSQLSSLPQEAEEQARTMEDLRKQVRDLERQLRAQPVPQADNKQLEAAEKRGYARGQEGLRAVTRENTELFRRLEKIATLAHVLESAKPNPLPVIAEIAPRPAQSSSPARPVVRRPPREPVDGDTTLGKCERAILSLLYNNPDRQFKKTMVGLFTEYSHKSGSFNNSVCHLNSLGLIQRVGECLQISEQGMSQAQELLGSDVSLHETFTIENWTRQLPRCDGMILEFLLQNPHESFTKDQIGVATGYEPTSGSFNNAVCHLNALALIVRESGRIRLNPDVLER